MPSINWRSNFEVLLDRRWKTAMAAGRCSNLVICLMCKRSMDGKRKMKPNACEHVFHEGCIEGWVQDGKMPEQRARCPVCGPAEGGNSAAVTMTSAGSGRQQPTAATAAIKRAAARMGQKVSPNVTAQPKNGRLARTPITKAGSPSSLPPSSASSSIASTAVLEAASESDSTTTL